MLDSSKGNIYKATKITFYIHCEKMSKVVLRVRVGLC